MFRRRQVLQGGLLLAGASLLPRGARAGEAGLLETVTQPQNLQTPIELFDRLITPNDVFFVRSHFGPPAYRTDRKVRIHGLVDKPLELGLEELSHYPQTTVTAVLQCAGNGRALHQPRVPGVQWEWGAMGQAEWTGVRLADVLKAAGLRPEAKHVQLQGADVPQKPTVPAFVRSIPLKRALAADTLIATKMNGVPLPLAHGGPMRLIVPGWSANHSIKWLIDVHPQEAEAKGFFMEKGYRFPTVDVEPGASVPPEKMVPVQVMPVRSVIARPADGGIARPGAQEIVGVAFSGGGEIRAVEVSLDLGTSWQRAKLDGKPGVGRWQVFRHRFDAKKPGRYVAMARATDSAGAVQTEKARWNPSGYFWSAIHKVTWEVAS